MLRPVFVLLCSATCLAYAAVALELTSPNGQICLSLLTDASGHLVYSITDRGTPRLASAPAGVIIDNTDLGAGAKLGESKSRRIVETFAWRGNKTQATNDCQAYEIPFRSEKPGTDWTMEVRVFNDGAAFRYRVQGAGVRRIAGESTGWQLPKDSTVWFQTDNDDYEGAYRSSRADAVPLEEEIEKRKRPTHLGPPVTIEYADGSFGLISEAALYRYSGLTLRPQVDASFRAAFEDDPQGWSHDGPILSPWRVIVLSKDLNGLVNSDVIPALCDAPDPQFFPDGMNTAWIKPGKAPCTWMVFGNDGAQWDRQKWFVDLCAATGCEYLLVDAGWASVINKGSK